MLKLRPVAQSDSQQLWLWANEPTVRQMSFHPQTIQWQDHVRWFAAKLSDPNCRFYLAYLLETDPDPTPGDRDSANRMAGDHWPPATEPKEIAIGQIRYDLSHQDATISLSLDQGYRQQGYGSRLIQLGNQKLLQTTTVCRIHAYIKPNNPASLRAFTKAGFQMIESAVVCHQRVWHLIYPHP